MKFKNQRGVTLIEILIVLFILGMIGVGLALAIWMYMASL